MNNQLTSWPYYAEDERSAVQAVLESGKVNYWTGDQGKQFEKEFANYHSVPHAICVANGSLALELGLKALGIGPGDEVIVTPRSFMASVSSVVQVGATPVFADVDYDTQNLSPESVKAAITNKTKAILLVHLAGLPCDMAAFDKIIAEENLFLIEDCAQAHGASIDDKKVGSFGDVAAFSFCQDKIMTTGGEGGMLLVKDSAVWERAWSFKDHGKSHERVHASDHPPGFRWLHESFGSNWRLTEMQAAIGRIQLQKLDEWVVSRNQHAAILKDYCQAAGLRVPSVPNQVTHAYYKFYAYLTESHIQQGIRQQEVIAAMHAAGFPVGSGACAAIYKEKAFTDAGIQPKSPLVNAEALADKTLMFPVHPTLTENQVHAMGERLKTCILDSGSRA